MESLEKNLPEGENTEALYKKAKDLFDSGKEQEATDALADLVKAHEMSKEEEVESLYEASKFLSQQGNYKKAAELLARAHKLSKNRDN